MESGKHQPETYERAREIYAADPSQTITAFGKEIGVTYKTAWKWMNALRSGTFGRLAPLPHQE